MHRLIKIQPYTTELFIYVINGLHADFNVLPRLGLRQHSVHRRKNMIFDP